MENIHILNALHDIVNEAKKNEQVSREILAQLKEINESLDYIAKITLKENL